MRTLKRLALLCFAVVACSSAAANRPTSITSAGPEHGHLIVVGGGRIGRDILERFIQLAGGPNASIVVIPTAGEDSIYPSDWSGLGVLERAGASNLTLLHASRRALAESDSFAKILGRADGIWR